MDDASHPDPTSSRALRRVGATLCGRYRLARLIGVGGMGAVYAGLHRNGHRVAVKVLHERLDDNPELERLLRREAHLANTVGHPGVVPVTDDDISEDGYVFLVMPLLYGETLRARWERSGRKLPVEEVCFVAYQTLEILGAAHAAKIVHRDIKPENIFLTREGGVRVLDFGIARVFQAGEASTATKSGRAVGTPAFMASEQALGRHREIDGRTDLWALGATMFSLLSGRFVHEAETTSEVLVMAATKLAQPLGQIAPEVPPAICAIVDRALRFHSRDRWEDAGAMARALLEAFESCHPGVALDAVPLAVECCDEHDDLHNAPTDLHNAPTVLPAHAVPPGGGGNQLGSGTTAATAAPPSRARSARSGMRLAVATSLAMLVGGAAVIGRTQFGSAKRQVAGPDTPLLKSPESPSAIVGATTVRGSGAGVAALDQETIAACAPSARGDLAAGLQLWRDASQWESLPRFEAAVSADPACAAASVYYLLAATHTLPRRREHFRVAREHRIALPPKLQDLLEAIGPSISDPPDNEEVRRRADALAVRYPNDPDVQRLFVRSLYNVERLKDAIAAADAINRRAAQPDPGLEFIVGSAYLRQADSENALPRLDRCLQLSPDSADCLLLKSSAVACDGNCEVAEKTLHRLVSVLPHSADGWGLLGNVLLADTGESGAARPAFEERWRNMTDNSFGDAPNGEIARLMDEYRMAIFDGDLRSAIAITARWMTTLGAAPGRYRADALIANIELFEEIGDLSAARSRSMSAMAESRSWPKDDIVDTDIVLPRLAYLAGALDANEFARIRDTWVGNRHPAAPVLWLEGYAALPGLTTNMSPPIASGTLVDHESWSPIEYYGRAAEELLRLNRRDDALRHAHEAAKMCVGFHALAVVHARLSLAKAYEATGDTNRACTGYERLRRSLLRTPESTTWRYATEHATSLHCSTQMPQ